MATAIHSKAYRLRKKQRDASLSVTLIKQIQGLIDQRDASRDVTLIELKQQLKAIRDAIHRHVLGSPNGSLRKGFPLDSLPKESPSLTLPNLIRPLDSEFDEIYEIYPRHIGKGSARRAFRSARKKATFEQIAAGIRRFATEHQTTEAEFIPHPATWLNGERWLDEDRKPNGHAATEHKPRYGRIRDPTEIAKELGLKP